MHIYLVELRFRLIGCIVVTSERSNKEREPNKEDSANGYKCPQCNKKVYTDIGVTINVKEGWAIGIIIGFFIGVIITYFW